LETQVLIIGAGVTGAGLARDLALRGIKCVVVEKGDVNAGASGGNHGLLHSGARYVSNDSISAQECRDEARLLRRLAPECIEDTGGMFVAVAGDDESYISEFPQLCEKSGIAVSEIDCQEARDLEPALSETIIAAYLVEDASVDPFRLSFDNLAQAESHGTSLLTHTQVIGIESKSNRINSVRLRQGPNGREFTVIADQVVNATGAWAGQVAALAGIRLPIILSQGTLLVTQKRVTQRVVNRLRPPADADIVVPGGTVSLVGTTSVRLNDLDHIQPSFSEVDFLVQECSKMLPVLEETRYIRAFAGMRPLVSLEASADDRSVSRGFVVLDHESDGLSNFVTVTGGKLTTYRLMAEKTADLVCGRLGVTSPCRTRELPLSMNDENRWVMAGLSPQQWLQHKSTNDALLCECEMVPISAVRQIIDHLSAHGASVDLNAIRLRSRLGKGPCQGAFCGLRAVAYLYETGEIEFDEGLDQMRSFLDRRWQGLRPVLWGAQLVQEQLQEAIHCGLLNLEL